MTSNRKMDVKAIVSIDGEIADYVSLKINQEMGNHHDFELLLDHQTFDDLFFDSPEKKLKLTHSKVICDLQHGDDEANAYVFVGLVTNVRMIAEDGLHGGVLLTGKSTTIELERGEMMQTYSNTNLRYILEEITNGTLNMNKIINPSWQFDIEFAIQHRESDWVFLQRICNQYNENFFYTGLDLQIGPHPEWPVVPLTYDKELRSLEVASRLVPNQFSHYYYKRDEHKTFRQESSAEIENSTQWLQQISKRSDRLTMSRKPNAASQAAVPDMAGLIEATKRQKVSSGAKMLYIRGECKTCDVRIGRLIQVDLPKNMGGSDVGLYRVYKVSHELDQVHRYRCVFEAIPADLKYIPMLEVPVPNIYPLECEVWDNNDPLGLGRIKVKFPFDSRPCSTWIPVMTLDAGGNGMGLGPASRGISFLPEISDSVLINFIDGPRLSHPVVIGSMFHGSNASNLGGGRGNHLKTIRDKSGGTIVFNTDESGSWGITIKDRNGNFITLDTSGKNIVVTAPETITMNAKNVRVNAEENITFSAGKDIQSSAGENVSESAGKTHTIQAKDKNVFVQENAYTDIKKDMILNVEKNATMVTIDDMKLTGGKILMDATDADMFVNATGKITLKSGDIVDIAE